MFQEKTSQARNAFLAIYETYELAAYVGISLANISRFSYGGRFSLQHYVLRTHCT